MSARLEITGLMRMIARVFESGRAWSKFFISQIIRRAFESDMVKEKHYYCH